MFELVLLLSMSWNNFNLCLWDFFILFFRKLIIFFVGLFFIVFWMSVSIFWVVLSLFLLDFFFFIYFLGINSLVLFLILLVVLLLREFLGVYGGDDEDFDGFKVCFGWYEFFVFIILNKVLNYLLDLWFFWYFFIFVVVFWVRVVCLYWLIYFLNFVFIWLIVMVNLLFLVEVFFFNLFMILV